MGLTILDAGIVIAILDAHDPHHQAASRALLTARDRGDDLAIPVSAYAECLVSPSRRGPDAVALVDRLLDALPVRVEPADRAIGAVAAALRAAHGPALRLPDALVIATALVRQADRVITTDTRWPSVGVPVESIAAAGAAGAAHARIPATASADRTTDPTADQGILRPPRSDGSAGGSNA